MDQTSLPFTKMNGLGNDFVIVDARVEKIALNEGKIRAICNHEGGIGCDQLLVVEPSQKADVFMRIYNADGSQVSACGNGTRCVARLIMDETSKDAATIETKAGILTAQRA